MTELVEMKIPVCLGFLKFEIKLQVHNDASGGQLAAKINFTLGFLVINSYIASGFASLG